MQQDGQLPDDLAGGLFGAPAWMHKVANDPLNRVRQLGIGHFTKVRESPVSKVKNVSGGPRYVPLLDREVADGETVEVPDFQPGHTDADPLPIVWPEATWEPVKAAKASAAKADDSKADTSGKAAS